MNSNHFLPDPTYQFIRLHVPTGHNELVCKQFTNYSAFETVIDHWNNVGKGIWLYVKVGVV